MKKPSLIQFFAPPMLLPSTSVEASSRNVSTINSQLSRPKSTLFRIMSITQTMTSVLAMRMRNCLMASAGLMR